MCLPAKTRLATVSPTRSLQMDSIMIVKGGASSSSCSSVSKPVRASSRTKPQHHHHHHAPLIVQHNYHDHAEEVPPTNIDPQELQMRCSASAPFPIKLQEMLDRVELDGYGHVVSWQPHGRCFVIRQPATFKELLPRYFKLSKIASFQRQLNLYGFQRITQGADKGGYYNEYFLKDKAFLAYKIQRIKVKGTGVRAKSNPGQEPDFWSMPWVNGAAASDSSGDNSSMMISNMEATLEAAMNRHEDAASIVSNDGDQQQPVSERFSLPPPPPLLSGSCSSSKVESSWFGGELVHVHHPAVTQLSEWGKPFFALDSLPEDIVTTTTTRKTCSAAAFTTKNTPRTDWEDQMDVDQVLDSMLQDLSREDEDPFYAPPAVPQELSYLLDQVVSTTAV